MGKTGKKRAPTAPLELFRVPIGNTKPMRNGQAPLGRPILPEHLWAKMPNWIALHARPLLRRRLFRALTPSPTDYSTV